MPISSNKVRRRYAHVEDKRVEKRNSGFVLRHHRCITAVHELDITSRSAEGSSEHRLLFPGVKEPEREYSHSLETNFEFRNLWNAISKPHIVLRCGAQGKLTAASFFIGSGSEPVAFMSAL
jgi:hypothetical protein